MEQTERYIIMTVQIWRLNFNFLYFIHVSAHIPLRTDGQIYIEMSAVRPSAFFVVKFQ